MNNNKNEVEFQILIVLFNATFTQMSMLTGVVKHRAKLIFKRWFGIGQLFVREMEKIERSKDAEGFYDELTDKITDQCNEMRGRFANKDK